MFLKNKNIISKIRRSKVTDYAALITINAQADGRGLHTYHIVSRYAEHDISKIDFMYK